MKQVLVLITFLVSLFSDVAIAADPLQERYSVVGVISESSQNADGIVMLLDRRLQKNLILKSGQALVSDPSFRISEVMSNSAVISNGRKSVTLIRDKFAEPVADNERQRSSFAGEDDFGVPRYADEEPQQGRLSSDDDDPPPFSDEEDYIAERQDALRKRYRAQIDSGEKNETFQVYRDRMLNNTSNRKF